MRKERATFLPHHQGKLPIESWQWSTEDILQVIELPILDAPDPISITRSIPLKECQQFIHGSGALLFVLAEHRRKKYLAFFA